MRHVVGGRARNSYAASTSQMGLFETEVLTQPHNLEPLVNLAGVWIDRVHRRRPVRKIILDMDPPQADQRDLRPAGRIGLQRSLRLSCHDFMDNQVRLSACGGFALAYNLGNFLRRLALPPRVKHWSLTTLREKLIKIGAKVVLHARYVIFQMAEVAVPRKLFCEILRRIHRLREPVPG